VKVSINCVCVSMMLKVFFVITEGILVLWSGVSMNVVRSVLMTVGQLAFYDQAKQALMGSGYFVDNLVTHFCSSVIAVCCLCLF
jgi:hypothetical protein